MTLAIDLARAELGTSELAPLRPATSGIPAGDRPTLPTDYPHRRPLLEKGVLRRYRAWPAGGHDLMVAEGDLVSAADAVARTVRRSSPAAIDLAAPLGVARDRAADLLVRQQGEMVAEGDLLAERRILGGLQRRLVHAPITGRLSRILPELGLCFVEPMASERRIAAHLTGRVVETGERGVTIEGPAVAVGGVAGAGPAVAGILIVAKSPHDLPVGATGAIVACAFPIEDWMVPQLADAGARAIVAPGVAEAAIDRLGWDEVLWPPPWRQGAAPPLTVVLLSPDHASLQPAVWEMLRGLSGRVASALGAEWGAAPEVLVMADVEANGEPAAAEELAHAPGGGEPDAAGGAWPPGTTVVTLAGRAEGLTGTVVSVAPEPYRLGSEARATVVDVAFPYGVRLTIPTVHLRAVE